MKRSESREHIFKMVFGLEFNTADEMPQQLELYVATPAESPEHARA